MPTNASLPPAILHTIGARLAAFLYRQAQLAAAAVQQETQERLRQAREALVNTREVLVSAVRPRTSSSCFPFSQRVTSTAAITPPMHACFDPYRQSRRRRFCGPSAALAAVAAAPAACLPHSNNVYVADPS